MRVYWLAPGCLGYWVEGGGGGFTPFRTLCFDLLIWKSDPSGWVPDVKTQGERSHHTIPNGYQLRCIFYPVVKCNQTLNSRPQSNTNAGIGFPVLIGIYKFELCPDNTGSLALNSDNLSLLQNVPFVPFHHIL